MSFDLQRCLVMGRRTLWLYSELGSLRKMLKSTEIHSKQLLFHLLAKTSSYFDHCVKCMVFAVFLDISFMTKENIALISQVSLTELQRANI